VFILDWNVLASSASGTSIDEHDDGEDNYDSNSNNDHNNNNNNNNGNDNNDDIYIDDGDHMKNNIDNNNKYDAKNDNNEYHGNNEINKNLEDHKNTLKYSIVDKDNEYGNKDRTHDLIIGSDLVYCEKDTSGVFNVISRYLSENGIFIIVVPKPSHRYGTEFLKPFLHNHGFTVYSRIISHTTCTSPEVLLNGVRDLKGWNIEKNFITDKNENFDLVDTFEYHDKSFADFLDSLIVNDDYLVGGLDEHEFISWDLIIGHRS
jgi:hypothetical protein